MRAGNLVMIVAVALAAVGCDFGRARSVQEQSKGPISIEAVKEARASALSAITAILPARKPAALKRARNPAPAAASEPIPRFHRLQVGTAPSKPFDAAKSEQLRVEMGIPTPEELEVVRRKTEADDANRLAEWEASLPPVME